MEKTRLIRINENNACRLQTTCQDNGWTIGHVANRLIERFLEGSFSGSISDVIRKDAGKN